EERLIDRFMADAHVVIVREVDRKSAGDLLRAPGFCPPPIFPPSMAPAFPVHHRAWDNCPARSHDGASQPLLHIGPQCRVNRKLPWFWSASGSLCVPLGCGPAILQAATSSRSIAPQFP